MNWTSIKEHKWIVKLRSLFQQGLGTKEMALSIAIGSYIGVLPLFGISTALVTAIAVWWRLNLPIAIFFTYAVGPIHILLIIPFIRLGEYIFGVKHMLLTVSAIKEAFQSDFFQALSDLALQIVCGVTGWIVIGIPVTYIFYRILQFSIGYFQKTN